MEAVRIGAKISRRANDWLDKKAEEMGVTKSALISFAVENYIKDSENQGLYKIVQALEEQGIKVKLD